MLNRQINVLRTDGTWGTAGVNVDNVDSKDYYTRTPESKEERDYVRALIAEDFKANKPTKSVGDKRKRRFNISFSVIKPFEQKELIYRHRKSSDLKVYNDGTWDYDAVESEDKNDKYLVE